MAQLTNREKQRLKTLLEIDMDRIEERLDNVEAEIVNLKSEVTNIRTDLNGVRREVIGILGLNQEKASTATQSVIDTTQDAGAA